VQAVHDVRQRDEVMPRLRDCVIYSDLSHDAAPDVVLCISGANGVPVVAGPALVAPRASCVAHDQA
jgi:hypothetical protein